MRAQKGVERYGRPTRACLRRREPAVSVRVPVLNQGAGAQGPNAPPMQGAPPASLSFLNNVYD